MACQPTVKTHDLAHEYLHRQPAVIVDEERKLYDENMEAPFEGDHWQERYESEVEGWSDSDDDMVSSDSGGPEEAIITPHRERPVTIISTGVRETGSDERDRRLLEAERELKSLKKGAYWTTGGEVVAAAGVEEGWRSVSSGISVASLSLALEEETRRDVKVGSFPSMCARSDVVGYHGHPIPAGITVCSLGPSWGHARLQRCFVFCKFRDKRCTTVN